MSLYARYKTDEELEKVGVWVPFPDGVEFMIRSTDSPAVKDVERRWYKKNRHIVLSSQGQLPDEAETDRDVSLAVAALRDWKNVTNEHGEPMIYSVANATKLFRDLKELRKEVLSIAGNMETFRRQEVEAIKGNSSAVSDIP